LKDYLHLALRYFGFAGLWPSERIKMKDCMFIIIVFIISMLVILATGIYIETL
jgi:hypothetical protein